MSKLDQEFEMVDVLRAEHMQLKGHLSDKGKQQIKDLMLELIGEDAKPFKFMKEDEARRWTARDLEERLYGYNTAKAEFRQRVSEL